jgi:hypothetical protein
MRFLSITLILAACLGDRGAAPERPAEGGGDTESEPSADSDSAGDSDLPSDTSAPADSDVPIDSDPSPDTGPLGDPWPSGEGEASPGVSLVAGGRSLAAGDRFVLRTGPAGRDEPANLGFVLTNRSASALNFSDGAAAWLTGDGFTWEVPPPLALAPEESARFVLAANGVDAAVATTFEATLTVPGTSLSVELVAEVPRPLRLVVAGDGGYVAVSDDYGASFSTSVPASGAADPSRVRSLDWGEGTFFRSSASGQGWSTEGQYASSVDGFAWPASGVAPDFWPSDCAYALGRFVCARSGTLTTSDEGRSVLHQPQTWQAMINALATDGERIVGVGRSGRRVVTLDGETWGVDHPSSLVPAPEYYAVAHGNDRFVAVGGNDVFVVASSPDGVTWTESAWGASQWARLFSVAWNGTYFLATGSSNAERLIWRSTDGVTWENVPEPSRWESYTLLGAFDGYFYGVRQLSDRNSLFRTVDGSSWTEVFAVPRGQALRAMAMEGRDRIEEPVESGSDTGDDTGYVGEVDSDVPADPSCSGPVFRVEGVEIPREGTIDLGISPALGGARTVTVEVHNPCDAPIRFFGHPEEWVYGAHFVVDGYPPVVLASGGREAVTVRFDPGFSSDHTGTLVLPHDGPASPFIARLVAESGPPLRLVAVGDGGYRYSSEDYGETVAFEGWTTLTAHTRDLIRGVCWGNGRFVGVGGNAESVSWVSADGVSWTDHEQPGSWLADCAYGSGIFVAVGYTPFWSTDGVSWERGTTFPPQLSRTMAYGDGVFVAGGDLGQVLTTVDGTAWDAVHSAGTDGFRASTFGGGMFVLTGDDGTVAASDDGGLTWLQQNLAGVGSLTGVAYAGGRFYAGDGASVYVSDDGVGWDRVNASTVVPRQGLGSTLFGWGGGALHRSDDGGFSWTRLAGATGGLGVLDLVLEGE